MSARAFDAAMIAALSPSARQALDLARRFDRDCDPATAWIISCERPADSPDKLARAIRARVRRERRQGGAHGPGRFDLLSEQIDAEIDAGGDPAALIEALQNVSRRHDIEQALAEREPALDTRALARRERISLRRAQQLLWARSEMERAGQGVLFLFGEGA